MCLSSTWLQGNFSWTCYFENSEAYDPCGYGGKVYHIGHLNTWPIDYSDLYTEPWCLLASNIQNTGGSSCKIAEALFENSEHFMMYAISKCARYREEAAARFSQIHPVHLGGTCSAVYQNVVPRNDLHTFSKEILESNGVTVTVTSMNLDSVWCWRIENLKVI